ncbi:hypothetical protein HN51_032156, partial [Arachis hypogaea]
MFRSGSNTQTSEIEKNRLFANDVSLQHRTAAALLWIFMAAQFLGFFIINVPISLGTHHRLGKIRDGIHIFIILLKGESKLLLQPRTTDQVSAILKYCNFRCLAVVPQGGNTGLIGGSVPVFDEVVVSLSAMSKIISFDKVSGILVCEAGYILENIISFLDSEGHL